MGGKGHDIMKYSIVMPYYKRASLLDETLASFEKYYTHRNDWEVLIIEDYKNQIDNFEHTELLRVIKLHPHINTRHLRRTQEQSLNPAKHFNMAVKESTGEYIVLTNPECKHQSDVLSDFDHVLDVTPHVYVVCNCYDNELGWLEHETNRRDLHWCSVIAKPDYWKIGGFDEKYADGIGFEDNDFAEKIKHSDLPIIRLSRSVVLHQSHEREEYTEPWYKNEEYFNSKWKNKENIL